MNKDLYEILGVGEKATAEELRKAYRDLAKKYHPDANRGDKDAEERFKAISDAYDILGNPEKREKYDQMRRGHRGFLRPERYPQVHVRGVDGPLRRKVPARSRRGGGDTLRNSCPGRHGGEADNPSLQMFPVRRGRWKRQGDLRKLRRIRQGLLRGRFLLHCSSLRQLRRQGLHAEEHMPCMRRDRNGSADRSREYSRPCLAVSLRPHAAGRRGSEHYGYL